MWITEEQALFALKTHIVTSWKQNVPHDVWTAWSPVALHLPARLGLMFNTHLPWCFLVSSLCKYQWTNPRKNLPLALCRLKTNKLETFCSLLCRYTQKQHVYSCSPKSVLAFAEVSHIMAVRSSSDIFSFFCMLQFSGKNFSTWSLSQNVADKSRW